MSIASSADEIKKITRNNTYSSRVILMIILMGAEFVNGQTSQPNAEIITPGPPYPTGYLHYNRV